MSFAEKTEPATPRRRRQARERGEVAKSQELVGAVILFAALVTLKSLAPHLGQVLEEFTGEVIGQIREASLPGFELTALGPRVMRTVAYMAGPILAVVGVMAVVTNLSQVGLMVTLQPLQPKAERLSPARGFKRMFSRNSVMELAKGLTKLGLVVYVAISFLRQRQETILALAVIDPMTGLGTIGALAMQMGIKMAATFLVVAAIDYVWQRHQFERSIRMSKEEVKQDHKQTDGDPVQKAHIRQRQREISSNRMIADVADASAVITNPTHIAVALRYEHGQESAPRCLAKGKGLIAQRIREVARENDVPLLENRPLAHSLYQLVRVGHEVPETLYQAVAEMLALVWRTAEQRRGGNRR